MTGPVAIDMATVRQRKRDMVDSQIAAHLQNYNASGAELIMGGRTLLMRGSTMSVHTESFTVMLTAKVLRVSPTLVMRAFTEQAVAVGLPKR